MLVVLRCCGLLRPINKQKRLKFTKDHEHWTIDQWISVLWTDESKFEIFGNKRRETNLNFLDQQQSLGVVRSWYGAASASMASEN